MIQTYADQNQEYIVDQLDANKMFLDTKCRYPCFECAKDDKDHCDTCWDDSVTGGTDPSFLMANGTVSTCKQNCDKGFSANNDAREVSEPKVCRKCDDSCDNCLESSIYDCVECNAPLYPFRLTGTARCLTACGIGYFQSTKETCSTCKSPCSDCFGTESNCTLCDTQSDRPVLYKN